MGILNTIKSKQAPFPSRVISIRQQLPLLICLLLLTFIILFGAISYIGVRRASMEIGQERLRSLTEELSSLFQQSAHAVAMATQVSANQEDILRYLSADPGQQPSPDKALEAIQKLRVDSQTVLVELQDTHGVSLLHTGKIAIQITARLNASKEMALAKPDTNFVGKIYQINDSMYFPVIATVIREKKAVGYFIRWRIFRATPEAIAQLSKLMGTKATLYFSNNDGTLWTNMLRPVAKPPFDTLNIRKTVAYRQAGGDPVIASALPIKGTRWIILVELSQKLILEAADRFLYWSIAIGSVLMVTGIFVAWKISRNITRPLDQLMHATAAIASGDYSYPVAIDRRDEFGKLAASFNSMTAQVRYAHDELERKVQARTLELEMANKELEAFSYSVSHDLRAPLRAVSGYAMMLKEDYKASLDDEAMRITGNIISNVKMMGRLIDDLIAFSRLGKREIVRGAIDMKALVESCVAELIPASPEEKISIQVDAMPECRGDEDMVKQVWMNLIGNALKYSSKNAGPCIEIGFANGPSGPVYFIRDNGAGFDMKYAGKLFKVFQRLHSQEEFEGTGVGLALVKRIIDKHKGEIRGESSPGKGATFYFSLSA
ncbi:MAG TPA: ATP-binding protein [Puia sp.]|nr:ATP-binding protein [Puia sp.]